MTARPDSAPNFVPDLTPDFTLDQPARLALAQAIRGNTLVETRMTPDIAADLDRVTVDERQVPTRAGPARVLVVTPRRPATGARPVFVNIHGGGFVRGHHTRDTVYCANLADRLDCVVLDLDYRLAPEHPFPAALHECHDVTAWAFAHAASLGADPARIAIGGHSAGGNLTAAVCQMATQSGAFRPCAQVLDYPFLDGVTPPEDKLDPDDLFPPARLHAFNVLYAGVPEALSDPLLSPLLAPQAALVGQPPALILIAGRDALRHEARAYAARLIDAGVDVTVRQFPDCDHGFLIACQPGFRQGRTAIADYLRAAFDRAAPTP
jgi:acetyl esterase